MQKGRFYKAKGHGLRNDCDSSCECLIISCLCFFFIPDRIKVPKSVIRSQTKMSSTGFSLPNILYMVCPTPKDDCTQAQPVTVGCPSRYLHFLQCEKKHSRWSGKHTCGGGLFPTCSNVFLCCQKANRVSLCRFFLLPLHPIRKRSGANAQRSPLAKTKRTKVATLHAPHSEMVPTAMPCAFDGSNIG